MTAGAGCDGGTEGEGRLKRGREDGWEGKRWLWERKGIRDLDFRVKVRVMDERDRVTVSEI